MRVYRMNVKKDGKLVQIKNWYADVWFYKKKHRLPLFKSKSESLRFAEKLDALVGAASAGRSPDGQQQAWLSKLAPQMLGRLAKIGLVEQSHFAASTDLLGHVDDYTQYLVDKGDTAGYAAKCAVRIKGIVKACRFDTQKDVQCSKIQKYLADEMRSGRIGQRTANHYVRAIKTFFNWMVQDGRCDNSPVRFLKMLTVTNVKKVRRALTVAEVGYLLDWLAGQDNTAYGLTAQQRRLVYLLSLTVGLRASEVGCLTSSSIDFKNKRVVVPSCYTKNRQDANLPLRGDVVEALRDYTAGMLPGVQLFKMPSRTADMLRADMAGARQAYEAEGGTDDSFLDTADVDYHGLRHSFGSMLAASGCSPKVAQELMRHSTITLTMDRYSHIFRGDDAAAVDNLPSFDTQGKMAKRKA